MAHLNVTSHPLPSQEEEGGLLSVISYYYPISVKTQNSQSQRGEGQPQPPPSPVEGKRGRNFFFFGRITNSISGAHIQGSIWAPDPQMFSASLWVCSSEG